MESISKFFGFEDKEKPEDAITMLKADHRKVKELVEKFQKSESRKEQLELLKMIVKELTVHSTLEEELVYPLIDKLEHDKTQEGIEEHHVVRLVLAELYDIPSVDEMIETKVKVLWEMVERHVKEEEGDLLPKLKRSGEDLRALGQQLRNRNDQLTHGVRSISEKSTKKASAARSIAEKTAKKPAATKKRVASKPRKSTSARSRQAG